jgi:PAS domain S-box-containing protein
MIRGLKHIQEKRTTPYGYLVAVVSVAVCVALTLWLRPFLQPMQLFFLWCAVLATAVISGARAAFVAVALSAGAAAWLIFEPVGQLSFHKPTDLARLALFVVFATAISAAVGNRRRVQAQAMAINEWLTTTLQSIGDAVIATDDNGHVVFMNRVAQGLTGWDLEEARGLELSKVFNIVNETTRQPVVSPIDRVLRERVTVGLANHTILISRDGREFGIDDSAAPIISADRAILGAVLVFHDITERRALEHARDRATAELRDAERKYRTLVEATPVAQAVFSASRDGRIHFTEEWAAITGTLPAPGDDGFERLNPADAARTRLRWREAISSNGLYDDEVRVRVLSGRYRWFAIRAVPIFNERLEVDEWVGVIADIHDRKQHEENVLFINRATALLSSSLDLEETMKTLARLCVPALGDWCGIDIATDQSYRRVAVDHVDPAMVKLLVELDQRFRPVPDRDPILAVLRSGEPQLVESIPDSLLEQVAVDEEHLALIRRLALQSWLIVPMTARGRTVGTITVATAESGRHYNEEDVPLLEELAGRAALAIDNARLFADATAASRAKDEFLITLSHELRTPLTAVVGWTSVLLGGGIDEETRRIALETILSSARIQSELIDELLDLSRVAAGKIALETTTVDLRRMLDDVVTAALPSAESKGLTLRSSSDRPSVAVRGDERRLRQIIWNLVTNAIKFSDRGGRIDARLHVDTATVTLEVADQGRGIDPAFLPHVWERFRQADMGTSREYGGLGLGLAIVKHLAEAHGGTVSVSSGGIGRGSTFRVELPLARGAAVASDPSDRGNDRLLLRGRKILVVDDDIQTRRVLAVMLQQYGASVTVAASTSEALEVQTGSAHDIVLTDLAMPGEDGFALLSRFKERFRTPVIAISAGGLDLSDRKRMIEAGFADFIRKPVEPNELAAVVARNLT